MEAGTMGLQVPVILGTVRTDRVGPRVARFITRALEQRKHQPILIDPVEYRLPLLDKMYKEFEPGAAPEALAKLAPIIKNADGYMIISGEYNHSVPPALSNLLDHFLEEYFFKPSAIVCYSPGPFGGVRAAMQLRAMLAEMGTPSIPSLLPFPKVHESLDADGKPANERTDPAAARFLDEFEWYANAMKAARVNGVPY
jgi:NAD(P)H-dependent FMN reductase